MKITENTENTENTEKHRKTPAASALRLTSRLLHPPPATGPALKNVYQPNSLGRRALCDRSV